MLFQCNALELDMNDLADASKMQGAQGYSHLVLRSILLHLFKVNIMAGVVWCELACVAGKGNGIFSKSTSRLLPFWVACST